MSNFGTTDFYHEVRNGNVPGHSIVSKFGENPDIDIAGGFETIWDGGGVYVPPTQARIHDVASSTAADAGTVLTTGSADAGDADQLVDATKDFVALGVALGDYVLNDDQITFGIVIVVATTTLTLFGGMRNAHSGEVNGSNEDGDSYQVVTNASTGASILHIDGLDASRLDVHEFVVLNGTSNVATVNSYLRQNRARIFGPGTTGAAGTITSTAQTDGTLTCQVINGNNQTLMAVYSIPSNATAYILSVWQGLSKKQTTSSVSRLRLGQLDSIGFITHVRALDNGGTSDVVHNYPGGLRMSGGLDMWMEADADANDTGVTAGFEVMLVENT